MSVFIIYIQDFNFIILINSFKYICILWEKYIAVCNFWRLTAVLFY